MASFLLSATTTIIPRVLCQISYIIIITSSGFDENPVLLELPLFLSLSLYLFLFIFPSSTFNCVCVCVCGIIDFKNAFDFATWEKVWEFLKNNMLRDRINNTNQGTYHVGNFKVRGTGWCKKILFYIPWA